MVGVTDDVSLSGSPLDERWSRLGEVVLLVGLPIGMLFVSLLLLLNLAVGVGVPSVDAGGGAAVLIPYLLLMLPYSVAGGALEAVYGAASRAVPCCFFVMLGAAAGIVFPVLVVSELGLFSGTVMMWSLVGAGAVVHMAAAATSLVLVRRMKTAQALRVRAASG